VNNKVKLFALALMECLQETYPTILVDMITRHTRAMSLLTLESYLKFLYKYVSYSSLQESKRDCLIIIPPRRGDEPVNNMKSNHREKSNEQSQWRHTIFSRGSRACRHATSPLCRPTLGGSAAKRCSMNLILTRTPQEPTHK